MQRAFTLIELSIVLVIIGLLVGGVLTGQHLIRSAGLRAVSADFEAYKAAVIQFKGRYGKLPGDYDKASTHISAECVNDAYTTCNGDGDGRIEWGSATGECNRAWQHMSLAGLINQSPDGGWCYTGLGCASFPGKNVPKGRISGSGYQLGFSGIVPNKHRVWFGTVNEPSGSITGSALSSTEAMLVDQKIDDGVADTGAALTLDGYYGGTPTPGNCLSGGAYYADDERRCVMYFDLD